MTPKRAQVFDTQSFLKSSGVAGKGAEYRTNQIIFSQSDRANSVMFLQKGAVEISVDPRDGRKAIVAILAPGEFFGLWCLAGIPQRMATATAIVPSQVLAIPKRRMLRLLHTKRALSDRFISFLLTLNIRVERDLLDMHFNPAEKRLARKLAFLAVFGRQHRHQTVLPQISNDTLAKMIGTTRARVSLFMNKFRRLGLIDYNGKLKVRRALLSIILGD